MNRKPIVYVDMDDTIVDFQGSRRIPVNEKHLFNHPEIFKEGFFLDLEPIPGAIETIRTLLKAGKYDVHILSQPIMDGPFSYKEKVEWITKYLPELVGKITLTQNKELLIGEYLIDDNIKWNGFTGELILFNYKDARNEFKRILSILG